MKSTLIQVKLLKVMKGNKNDFSMTFYNEEEKRLFMEFVHDTNKAIQWEQ